MRRLTAALGLLGLFLISSNALAQSLSDEPCPRGYILDFKAAVRGCSKVIGENPQAAWAYNIRGQANSAMGNRSLAIPDFSKAIELEPRNETYLLHRALLLMDTKAFEHAIADADKSIELNPKSAGGYVVRAIIHVRSGNDERATQDCNLALKIDPTQEVCKLLLASSPSIGFRKEKTAP